MAGDWIKFEHASATKPEVCLAAEMLGISRREMVGLLVDYWIWLDANLDETRYGLVTQVSRKSLEEVLHCAGLAAILERIGWANFDDEERTLTVKNWDRHTGKTAKSRALTRDRMKRMRDDSVTRNASPEKRREDNYNNKYRRAAFGWRPCFRCYRIPQTSKAQASDPVAGRLLHFGASRGLGRW